MLSETSEFVVLANQVGEMVAKKNAAYGNSFSKCADFLALLYPDGVPPDKYRDLLTIVRIFDKLMRIANEKEAFSESPYKDIVGYGLLGLQEDERARMEKR